MRRLIERGLPADRQYLSVIDGSKTLRSALGHRGVLRRTGPLQRHRVHKQRNVLERLPRESVSQSPSIMKAACKLSADNGITKLKTHAAWLKADHPDASPTLLVGPGETFW